MFELPGFWHAAAVLGGRIDLSRIRDRLGPGCPDVRALCAAGLPIDHATAVVSGRPRSVPDPFVTLGDDAYPPALAPIPYAPPVLFLRGNASLLGQRGVAIVGSRRCTAAGERMARDLGRAAAAAGLVVVSGLAYGVDAAAHRGAGGQTVAILGQGLGVPLSGHQERLAAEILGAGGLIASEYLPEVPAATWTFPRRNRVIAGLAAATVVVEGTRSSGALITARRAAEAGRDVLAVPGSPYADASAGCLDLLSQGAGLVRDSTDMLRALGIEPKPQPPPRGADPDGLLGALGAGGTFDELCERTALGPGRLSRALAALELTGLVRRLPGERYVPVCTAR